MIRLDRAFGLGERRQTGVIARALCLRLDERLSGASERMLGRPLFGAGAAFGADRLRGGETRLLMTRGGNLARRFGLYPPRTEVVEPGALPQPDTGGSLDAGGSHVAIPTPECAIATGETLSGT